MKNFHNHHLLLDAEFIGYGYTVNKYYMCGRLNVELDEFEDGRQFSYPPRKLLFPYIYQTDKTHKYKTSDTYINGELYKVEKKTIDLLDAHEGHPTVYKRTTISINLNSSIIETDAYILENHEILSDILSNKNAFIPILNGSWTTSTQYGL